MLLAEMTRSADALCDHADAVTSKLDAAVAERDALAVLLDGTENQVKLANGVLVFRSSVDRSWVAHSSKGSRHFPTAIAAVRFGLAWNGEQS